MRITDSIFFTRCTRLKIKKISYQIPIFPSMPTFTKYTDTFTTLKLAKDYNLFSLDRDT